MSRSVVLVSLLVIGGCKRSEPPAPAVAGADAGAAAAAAAVAPPAPLVVIDDAVVERFVKFDQQYLAAVPQRMQQMLDELKQMDKAAGGAPPDPAAGERIMQRMNAEDDKLRAAAGITKEQQEALQDLSSMVAGSQKNAAEMQRKIDGLRGALDTLPPAERPAMLAQLESLERRVRDARGLLSARRRFGDAAVEAALRHQSELTPLLEKQMAVFQQAMKLMSGGRGK